ncbi:hypothetical protein [Natrononativus amylolyticus]|uniref:hypothetical protein n=1 Tax=Natrononativus amylolyticus TaxID=2963434 RepID=UPI0020CFC1DB|nr:hypothetical protein [Natrononativus amylolyticus]
MRRSIQNLVLAVGFFAVAAAIAIARAAPATGYEGSIYAATPTATWAGLAVGLGIAVCATVVCRRHQQHLAIGLGALSVTAIVSLPVIRNYRFLGLGDGLTHLGWARDFVAGDLLPHQLFYPGLHAVTSALHLLGGIPLERAMLITVVLLFVPFVVFVPLVVRDVTGNAMAVGFAAVASWFVLPINNVATHMGPHTNSNALFLVPVALFAFVAFLRRRGELERLPFGLSPFSALVIVVGVGLLLVHPQQMINVVVVIGTIAGVQFLARRRYPDHPIVTQPTVYAHTAVLGGLFVIWALSNERFRRALAGLLYGLLTQDIGGSAEVDQREASLTAIGGSMTELFAKMFLVAAVIGLIAALFVLLVWLGRTSLDAEARTFVTYFALALIPLGGMFLVYFVGTPTMAFRQVGFIYVMLTILGGIAVAHGIGWLSGPLTTPGATALAATFLGACLVLSLLTVFASPIIYNPTQHVSDQQMSGYESAIEHRNDDLLIAGLGYGPDRFGHAINGVEPSEEIAYGGGAGGVVLVDEFEAGNYSGAYHGMDYHFTVSAYDTTREFEVYQELHHSEAALAGLEAEPGANKVISNEEFRMYTVSGES